MTRAVPLLATAGFLFLHLPLFILALFSFNASRLTVWEGFSLRWFSVVLRDAQLAEAALNSLVIAALATLLATIAGTLCAYTLWKKITGGSAAA
jgi:ABC-type spermidine/putrescine transport system, permease component II